MCMFCAAVPVTAAAGVALDSKQRKQRKVAGLPVQRFHPILIATVFVILLLMLVSAYFHIKYPRYF